MGRKRRYGTVIKLWHEEMGWEDVEESERAEGKVKSVFLKSRS
jgi:hypothetical protein